MVAVRSLVGAGTGPLLKLGAVHERANRALSIAPGIAPGCMRTAASRHAAVQRFRTPHTGAR